MARLTLEEMAEIAAEYVAADKIAIANLPQAREAITNLVLTIGAIFTLDTSFKDKLSYMDAEELSYGKTVEEWQMDLLLPTDFDANGTDALKPSDPSFRPASFSITLGEKTFKTTERRNTYNRAVHNEEQLGKIVSMIMKRLYDSKAVWFYDIKRAAVGRLIELAEATVPADTSAAVFVKATAYAVNTLVKDASTATKVGIIVKTYTANAATDWSDAVKKGYIVVLDLVTLINPPTDAASGEAFLIKLKEDVEKASDNSEGHSLNGNTIGSSEEGLVLLIKQGIMPSLEVNTQAGAFHLDKVAIPVDIIVVPDFGKDIEGGLNHSPFAVLMDRRTVRKFSTENTTDTDHNGQGHFDNYYLHTEDTIHISRNTFIRVYEQD